MNIDLKNVSPEARKAIEAADAALIAAGLPNYTDVVASRQSLIEHSRNMETGIRDNDRLTAKLLDAALRHLDKNNPVGARDVIQSVRGSLIIGDDNASV